MRTTSFVSFTTWRGSSVAGTTLSCAIAAVAQAHSAARNTKRGELQFTTFSRFDGRDELDCAVGGLAGQSRVVRALMCTLRSPQPQPQPLSNGCMQRPAARLRPDDDRRRLCVFDGTV